MKLPFFVFFTLCVLLSSISGYNFAYAFFMSAAANNSNSFTAAEIFPTSVITPTITLFPTVTATNNPTNTPTVEILTSTPTSTITLNPTPTITNIVNHIVINEIFPIASSSAEWVELYNPTNSPIDISGWKIADKNAFDTTSDDVIPTTPPIPAGEYTVIITNNSVVTGIPISAQTIILSSPDIGSGLNNTGGDAVYIKDTSNNIIDAMNYGTDTSVFSSAPNTPTATKSLARYPNGADNDVAADWVTNSTPSIGISN